MGVDEKYSGRKHHGAQLASCRGCSWIGHHQKTMCSVAMLTPNTLRCLLYIMKPVKLSPAILATPVKYFNPEIKNAIGSLEHLAKEKIFSMLPSELQKSYEGLIFPEEKGGRICHSKGSG